MPYRDIGPWVASCDLLYKQGQKPPPRGESIPLQGNPPDPPTGQGREPYEWCLPDTGSIDLNSLIVTLPDPITTHLALYFDRSIESIESAMQRCGFLLDRYWLPWPMPGQTISPGDTSQDLRENSILAAIRGKQPGLIIFSRSPESSSSPPASSSPPPASQRCPPAPAEDQLREVSQQLLYVFLVSESPTAGINKTQFLNAVEYEHVLRPDWGKPIAVVGPFFSGSARLAVDLKFENAVAARGLDFVSGTMTSPSQASVLRGAGFGYRGILHDDNLAQEFLLCLLREQRLTRDGGNVVILQEAETQYGSNTGAQDSDNYQCPGGQTNPFPRLRYIKFPRELSRLRNASADDYGSLPSLSGQSLPSSLQGLSWNWKDSSNDVDGVPSFSGAREPLSQQSVLLEIANTLRQRDIRYVGIIATDVVDILFLSKFLKLTAPNTRLFVLDADLLMVGSGTEGRELSGTLAITTYPLMPRVEEWFRKDGQALDVHPSRLSAGVDEAVSAQLRSVFAGTPTSSQQEGSGLLWLTMVGRSDFWPVALIPGPVQPSGPAKAVKVSVPVSSTLLANWGAHLSFEAPDGATLLLEGALFAWAFVQVLAMHLARREKWFEWLAPFQVPSPTPQSDAHHAYYLYCASAALSAMCLLVASTDLALQCYGRIDSGYAWLFTVFNLGLLALAIELIPAAKAIAPIQDASGTWTRPILWSPWIPYGLTVLIWAWLLSPFDHDAAFFTQRAFHLTNGVSPLLPVELLLLLYYIWAWIFIRKVRLSLSRGVKVPKMEGANTDVNGLQQYLKDLRIATDALVFNPQFVIGVGAAYGATFVFLRPWKALRSIEGWQYDFLIVSLVFLVCLLIVLSLVRYLYMWDRLRRILRGLERTNLRRAFDRFPKGYSWSPLWYEDAARRAYTISARSHECYRSLVTLGAPATAADLADMTKAYKLVISANADPATKRTQRVAELQTIFVDKAELLLTKLLLPSWGKEVTSDSLDVELEKRPITLLDDDSRIQVLAEEFVALRFVGLIHYQSAQMKNLVLLLAIEFILGLIAIGSYPFLAGRECVWSLAAVFVLFGAAIVATFAQMDRDAILSRLSRTDPGKLDWSFFLRVASFGTLPLLALLTSQFPSIGRALFAWLQPALNSIH